MKHPRLFFAALLGCGLALTAMAQPPSAAPAKRYIVHFVDGKAANGKAALKAAGGIVKRDLARHNAVAAEIPEARLGALRSNPDVRLVEEDALRYPASMVRALPSGADRGVADHGNNSPEVTPYGVTMVQAAGLTGNTASGVRVCVIDTGYDVRHEDLPGTGTVTGTDDPDGAGPWDEDGYHHGTHVAGTITALDNDIGVIGVFPSVPLHIVRVFNNAGSWAYSSDLVHAVDVCIDNGANVINMSLGGYLPSALENATFLHALKNGVLSVAAAGNEDDGRGDCDMFADPGHPERQACKIQYPAAYDSVVSVGAVDSGANVASFSQRNVKVELAAPGVSVLSTVPTGSMMDVLLEAGGETTDVVPMDNFDIPAAPVSGLLQDCGLGETAADCGDATDKVCLIERGAVTFATKALSCQEAGGVAAVVFQSETGGTGPVLGTLGDTFVDIPVVGTDRTRGLALRAGFLGTSATLSFLPSHYDYDYFNGTSMATPHVAGVAALIWSRHPQCGPTDIREALKATAVDLGTPGRDRSFGYGLIQAQDADQYLADHGCTGN